MTCVTSTRRANMSQWDLGLKVPSKISLTFIFGYFHGFTNFLFAILTDNFKLGPNLSNVLTSKLTG